MSDPADVTECICGDDLDEHSQILGCMVDGCECVHFEARSDE